MSKFILLILGSMMTFSTIQAATLEIETGCDQLEYVFENINEKLPEDRQFTFKCEESFKSKFWGAVKYDFKAVTELSNVIELCEDAEYSFSKEYDLGYGAHIGISTKVVETLRDIMFKHSVDIEIGMEGSAVGTMYNVRSIKFPACNP